MLVVEQAAENPAGDVAARRARKVDSANAPFPHQIHPLEQVRHPADLTLGIGDRQAGKPLER
ncbi:hypothetical protein [Parafrankia sp. CH37]|uniref:hypothetical protein n=1 Tax=Parafrankia sp. CH37 TaxID=683308 RepID=UPI001868DF00|nr:hypothetical protein [Parafrankia sp. CH37]MBE3202754.1 hypothetical protein [Parafrankia sp. CH37]